MWFAYPDVVGRDGGVCPLATKNTEVFYSKRKESKLMVSKKASKKAGKKGRIKTLKLKREAIKDLSGREKKKVKGGGGVAGGVVQSRVL